MSVFHYDCQRSYNDSLICFLFFCFAQANPANRAAKGIKNALELFKFNSVHGGLWRAAYKVDSIGEVSALIYFIGGPKAFLPVAYAILGLIAFLVAKFILKVI